MSILYAPQTTPVLAALTAARKERQKRIGAPPTFNIFRPKPKPTYVPLVVTPEPPPAPRPAYVQDARYERAWMIAICGGADVLDRNLSVRTIQDAVCDRFGVSYRDLISSRRTASLVLPRHISMHLCRRFTTRSHPDIGRFHGNRDHTVSMFADRKIAALIKTDADIAEHVEAIRGALHV